MPASKTYQLAIQLGAATKSGFSAVFKGARGQINALATNIKKYDATVGKMSAWRKLGDGVLATNGKLQSAKKELLKLGRQMDATANPTAKLRREYDAAASKVQQLGTKLRSQRADLKAVSEELKKAGINTKNFTAEQSKLEQRIAKLTSIKGKLQADQAALDANAARGSAIRGKMRSTALQIGMLAVPFTSAAKYEHELKKNVAIGGLSGEDTARQDALYRRLGATTEYTATEAARTGVVMSRAGMSTAQIEKGLPAVLDMATAADMSLEETASILSDAMNAFGLTADQMKQAADVLTKSANIANTDVSQLGETFKYVAPYAHTLGVSMEEVGAMAGIMADAGIKSTMGGTAMREMMSRLAAPTKEAADQFERLGVSVLDNKGNMRPMVSILKQLSQGLKGMGNAEKMAAMQSIGGKRGAAGLVALIEALDSGKLNQKLKTVQNSMGSTAAAAAKMREGVAGSWHRLTSAIEGLGLAFTNGKLRDSLSSLLDSLATSISKLTAWLEKNPELVAKIGKMAGAFLMTKMSLLGVLYAGNKVHRGFLNAKRAWHFAEAGVTSLSAAFAKFGGTAGGAALATKALTAVKGAMLALSGPVGLTILGIGALSFAAVKLYQNWDKAKEIIIKGWDKIKGFATDAATLVENGWNKLWSFFDGWGDRFAGWIKSIPSKIAGALESFCDYVKNTLATKLANWWKDLIPEWMGGTPSETTAAAEQAISSPSKGYNSAGTLSRRPGFASGGRIARPTLSWIGEGGSPEYVIPTGGAARNRGLSLWHAAGRELGASSSGTININFSPNITVGSTAQRDDVMSALQQAVSELKRELTDVMGAAGTSRRLSFGA